MRDPILLWVVASGILVATGLFLAITGVRGRTVRLADALDLLSSGAVPDGPGPSSVRNEPAGSDGDLASRLGAWAFTRLHLPLSDRNRRALGLRGRSIGDFFAEKLILFTVGLVSPLMFTAVLQGFGRLVTPVPMAASLGLAALGWFWPEIGLRRSDRTLRADAGEALFTFFDLVTLERLANASAAQAMMSAASLSDVPLFLRLRTALERARLEQRPPWQELHRLAQELEVPEIADIADVMRLDEQGAALSETLRARVRELRDAHLLAEKLAAHQVSERMTLWMVIPSMIFGLVFLTPPVLKLLGVAP
ncbi:MULTISPECIES: hypothetical protein [unclassified Luteococcus]|uniref:hypothetical protein n=1 Tax=unclassified Luteococcus TaxID=2639923 RepID=UPI00313E2163